MQVLVADDERTMRVLLRGLLRKWGYDVIVAEDGVQAWGILRRSDGPRLAVLDWMMPDLDGVEVCRKLREDTVDRYVYTLLVTHRDGQGDLATALDAGADDYVRKPVNPAELRSRLAVGSRVASYDIRLEQYAAKMEQLAESRAQQLVHADRMATLGLLSAGVAHEINNPAAFISGNVQTLKRFWTDIEGVLRERPGSGDGEIERKLELVIDAMPEALDGIHDGVRRIAKIVKGLKLYARQDRGCKSSCAVNRCVERALELCKFQLVKSHTTVEHELRDVPAVHADPQQLEQVLVNLFVNAVHAMDGRDDSLLRVESSVAGDTVSLCVEDRGPGIDPAVIDKIWDPFFTTKEVGKGTGLGLAICRSIIEDHDGHLSAENRPDRGARFVIQLPAQGEKHP